LTLPQLVGSVATLHWQFWSGLTIPLPNADLDFDEGAVGRQRGQLTVRSQEFEVAAGRGNRRALEQRIADQSRRRDACAVGNRNVGIETADGEVGAGVERAQPDQAGRPLAFESAVRRLLAVLELVHDVDVHDRTPAGREDVTVGTVRIRIGADVTDTVDCERRCRNGDQAKNQ
jgi:hypothetical protein